MSVNDKTQANNIQFNSVGKGIAFFFSFDFLHQDCKKRPLVSVQTNKKLQPELLPDWKHFVGTACLRFIAPLRHVRRHAWEVESTICVLKGGLCWSICALSKRRCWSARRRRNLQQNIVYARCHNTFRKAFILISGKKKKNTTEDFRGVPVQKRIGATRIEKQMPFQNFFSSFHFEKKVEISWMKLKFREWKSNFRDQSGNFKIKVKIPRLKVEMSRIKLKCSAHKPCGVLPFSPVCCLLSLYSQNFFKLEMETSNLQIKFPVIFFCPNPLSYVCILG